MKSSVLKYYEFIDEDKLSEALSFFSDDIVYTRGEQEFNGMADFRSFYINDRKLNGRHIIREVYELEEVVVVKGTYVGINGSGKELDLNFSDFFYFDDRGKIRRRETFLANGFVLIT